MNDLTIITSGSLLCETKGKESSSNQQRAFFRFRSSRGWKNPKHFEVIEGSKNVQSLKIKQAGD